MAENVTKVTCPSCHTTYRIRLEDKGIQNQNETFQLACHACGHVWTPQKSETAKTTPAEPKKEKVSPPIQPQAPTPPPPPQQPSPASWTPPPSYSPPPPPPFVPPQPIQTKKKNVGTTVGLIVLGTCIIMACIVGVLRHKDGKYFGLLAPKSIGFTSPNSDQQNESLTIRDVRFDVQQTGKRQTILVVGMIDNTTSHAFTLHPLQVSVWGPADQEGVAPTAPKDKEGNCLLISWQHPFDVLHIDRGQSRPFQTVGSIPSNLKISRVDVTLP